MMMISFLEKEYPKIIIYSSPNFNWRMKKHSNPHIITTVHRSSLNVCAESFSHIYFTTKKEATKDIRNDENMQIWSNEMLSIIRNLLSFQRSENYVEAKLNGKTYNVDDVVVCRYKNGKTNPHHRLFIFSSFSLSIFPSFFEAEFTAPGVHDFDCGLEIYWLFFSSRQTLVNFFRSLFAF